MIPHLFTAKIRPFKCPLCNSAADQPIGSFYVCDGPPSCKNSTSYSVNPPSTNSKYGGGVVYEYSFNSLKVEEIYHPNDKVDRNVTFAGTYFYLTDRVLDYAWESRTIAKVSSSGPRGTLLGRMFVCRSYDVVAISHRMKFITLLES